MTDTPVDCGLLTCTHNAGEDKQPAMSELSASPDALTDEELSFLRIIANIVYSYSRNSGSYRIILRPVLVENGVNDNDAFAAALAANANNTGRFYEWAERLLEEKWIPSTSEIADALALANEGIQYLETIYTEHISFDKNHNVRGLNQNLPSLYAANSNLDELKVALTKNYPGRGSSNGDN